MKVTRQQRAVMVGVVAGVVLASSAAYGATHLVVASAAYARPAITANSTVEVSGEGEVDGTPNAMTIQLGVSSNAQTASAALLENDLEMSKLQKTLEQAGVAQSDLATDDLELSPNYDTSGTITGYGADDELVVTLTDLRHAGGAIDAATDAVGNDVRIEGLTFSISNESGLREAAREDAMRDAQRAAAVLAHASDARLGPVEKITDNEQVTAPSEPYADSAAAGAASVPIEAGTEKVSDHVTVVYALER